MRSKDISRERKAELRADPKLAVDAGEKFYVTNSRLNAIERAQLGLQNCTQDKVEHFKKKEAWRLKKGKFAPEAKAPWAWIAETVQGVVPKLDAEELLTNPDYAEQALRAVKPVVGLEVEVFMTMSRVIIDQGPEYPQLLSPYLRSRAFALTWGLLELAKEHWKQEQQEAVRAVKTFKRERVEAEDL